MSSRIKMVQRALSTVRTPPISPPSFRRTAPQIAQEADQFIARATETLDAIAAEPNPTFKTVFEPYSRIENESIDTNNVLPFYLYVSAEENVRNVSQEVTEKLSTFELESSRRLDVYRQLKKVYEAEKDSPTLSTLDKRYLDKVMLDMRRNGLDLSDEKRAKLTELDKELESMGVKFGANLSADKSFELFTKEQLAGVSESVLENFEQVDGKYKVTFNITDYTPVLKECSVPETRRTMMLGYENRVPQNGPLFERALALRGEISQLLGYKTFAENILAIRMAKTPETVGKFLDSLVTRAKTLGAKEKEVFLQLKREEEPGATEVYAWDSAYYQNKVVQREFQVDQEHISHFFEINHTIEGMFDIFSKLMGLKFDPVVLTDEQKWHEDVTAYAIYQTENGADEFKGYLYLDMHPRDNKYGHFANFGLYQGHAKEDGSPSYPVSALVCNFPRPTDKRPSLLYHRDVVTFFHELGHGIHATLGLSKYGRFSGTRVSRDFVETPSQLLENWIWDPVQLKKVSKHYQTGEPLDDKTIDGLIKSKNANQATFVLRQLFFGIFDFKAHTATEPFDVEKNWNELRDEIMGLPSPDRLHGYNQFAHMMHGYECGYYGYMWSLVFAADIWKTLFKADPLNPEKGAQYRDGVIAMGGTEDADLLLSKLLGREPNNVAFFEEIGLA